MFCRYGVILPFFFYTLVSSAETREEIKNQNQIREGHRPIRTSELLDVGKLGPEEHTFVKKESFESVFIHSIVSAPKSYSNTIDLNFFCREEGRIPIIVPYKLKDIQWSVSKGESLGVYGGINQTDTAGKFWLRFTSKGQIDSQSVKLYVGKQKLEISLRQGPDIYLPMKFCKSAE